MDKVQLKAERKVIVEINGEDHTMEIPSAKRLKEEILPLWGRIQDVNHKIVDAKAGSDQAAAIIEKLDAMREFVEIVVPTLKGNTGDLPLAQISGICDLVVQRIMGGKAEASPTPQA